MARNPAAQTASGPMVLAAVEQYEDPARRLVHDDLARAFLPAVLRALVATTRLSALRRAMIGATERSGPGLWANLACRKRYIDEKLDESLPDIDAVVVLGAGLDTRAYRLARRSDIAALCRSGVDAVWARTRRRGNSVAQSIARPSA